MSKYIRKSERQSRDRYLNHEPGNLFLTREQIIKQFPDVPKRSLSQQHTFMWDDNIITIKNNISLLGD